MSKLTQTEATILAELLLKLTGGNEAMAEQIANEINQNVQASRLDESLYVSWLAHTMDNPRFRAAGFYNNYPQAVNEMPNAAQKATAV